MAGCEGPVGQDRIVVIECNIDDMTGEQLGYLLDQLLDAGALDAWHTPIQMKKSRPGTMLSVLCRKGERERLGSLLLRESSTLGVRWHQMERMVAKRKIVTVETDWGPVSCKLKIIDGTVFGIKPEYDDCATIAQEYGMRLALVQQTVLDIAKRSLDHTESSEA